MTKVILDSDKYLFIVKEDKSNMNVIRPVSLEQLKEMRTLEGCKDYHKEIWVQAVTSDSTEDSLDDFCQSLLDELDANNDEDFPFKDNSGTDILDEFVNGTSETLRTIVDDFIQSAFGYKVGTWESSGSYSPKEKDIVAVFYVDN